VAPTDWACGHVHTQQPSLVMPLARRLGVALLGVRQWAAVDASEGGGVLRGVYELRCASAGHHVL
jgi:hypothetical protein